ncbi:site-2 protease family protein [Anaerosalibacter massiliensis]|uniref:Site-2 protease family protein n=1 Tax=Anaerosalibacter massiliensis TaxID=1347392 RepID=A0A9X2MG81_9FIRM|nr:site-2 protease family protein [Anaerosalibacter massiliensis]MCR2042642.1 site-2 protease family protein [Anaerosalibacter massiliensis]
MILEKIISLPGLFIAIIFHELAHGYTAYKLGDPTAKEAGRLTLNPLKHIDIVGFLFMLVFKFGWAKPVPINPSYFKKRKRDTILVSLAGPLTNFVIAIISAFIISTNIIKNSIFIDILIITLWYNIMLGVFNLLPFPPLDGSKVVASILPVKWEYKFYKYERYLYLILVFLVISNTIDKILGPLINISLNLLLKIVS